MKINNAVIFSSKPALEELLKTDLPVKCAWQIAMLSGKLATSLQALQTTKDNLVRKYGESVGTNISIAEDSPNWGKFVEELNELFTQDVELVFDKIELPQQVDGKDLKLKPEILLAIKDFVVIR